MKSAKPPKLKAPHAAAENVSVANLLLQLANVANSAANTAGEASI
jgi:hypothetical protein